jgi:hypothetical protein
LPSLDLSEDWEMTVELAFVPWIVGTGPHLSAIDFFNATMTSVEVGYKAFKPENN